MERAVPPLLSELLGQRGLFQWLAEMQQSQPLERDSIIELMERHRVVKPLNIFSLLLDSGVVIEAGDKFVVSSQGRRAWLLLSGVNGADLREVLRQLSQMHPALVPYEFVTEGMTGDFIDGLYSRPDFKRLYICSPWISLESKMMRKFVDAVYKAESRSSTGRVRIIMIARPLRRGETAYPAYLDTFRGLAQLGADIVVHRTLHTKLYIREPGLSGGLTMAVFGSENLTSKRNIELGVKITNDNVMIGKLIRHFYEIYNQCERWKEETHE